MFLSHSHLHMQVHLLPSLRGNYVGFMPHSHTLVLCYLIQTVLHGQRVFFSYGSRSI